MPLDRYKINVWHRQMLKWVENFSAINLCVDFDIDSLNVAKVVLWCEIWGILARPVAKIKQRMNAYVTNCHVSFWHCGMEQPAGSRHGCAIIRGLQTVSRDISVFTLIPWHCHLTQKLHVLVFYTCVDLATTSLFRPR